MDTRHSIAAHRTRSNATQGAVTSAQPAAPSLAHLLALAEEQAQQHARGGLRHTDVDGSARGADPPAGTAASNAAWLALLFAGLALAALAVWAVALAFMPAARSPLPAQLPAPAWGLTWPFGSAMEAEPPQDPPPQEDARGVISRPLDAEGPEPTEQDAAPAAPATHRPSHH